MNIAKLENVTQPQDIQREHVASIGVGRSLRGATITLHDGRKFNVSNSIKDRLFDADYFTRQNLGDNPADGHVLVPVAPDFDSIMESMMVDEAIGDDHRNMIGIY